MQSILKAVLNNEKRAMSYNDIAGLCAAINKMSRNLALKDMDIPESFARAM